MRIVQKRNVIAFQVLVVNSVNVVTDALIKMALVKVSHIFSKVLLLNYYDN